MKLFVIRLFGYTTLLFLLLGALDFFVFPKNTNVMSIKNTLLKDKTAEVLVLGNSHTFFGLDPALFTKKTINIANKSRKIESDYFILKNNLKALQKIKVVIVPISHYTLFTENISQEEKRLYYNFYELEEYNQGIFYNSLVLNESFKELVDDAISKNTRISNLGWRANDDKYKFDKKIIDKRVGNIEERLSRKLTIEKNSYYLKKIINLCHNNKIQLFLLLPPYHPDFYTYSNHRYNKKNKSILKTLDLKSSLLIESDVFKIVEDKYFENIDHLNKNGAILFSKKIDSLINLKVHD
mgnify:CR=1 FL=1